MTLYNNFWLKRGVGLFSGITVHVSVSSHRKNPGQLATHILRQLLVNFLTIGFRC